MFLIIFAAMAIAAPPQTMAADDGVVSFAQPNGQTKVITNSVTFPSEANVVAKKGTLVLGAGGHGTNVAVDIVAYRHLGSTASRSTSSKFTSYEFALRSEAKDGFVWSCWTPAFLCPHSFQVFVTLGRSYACYVREGVHLYSLSEPRDSETMRRGFFGDPDFERKHPDALPVLPMAVLRQHLGGTNTIGLGPRALGVSVKNVLLANDGLHVTVCGTDRQVECVFRLQQGQWQYLSVKHSE
jgi:hypothetical protein